MLFIEHRHNHHHACNYDPQHQDRRYIINNKNHRRYERKERNPLQEGPLKGNQVLGGYAAL